MDFVFKFINFFVISHWPHGYFCLKSDVAVNVLSIQNKNILQSPLYCQTHLDVNLNLSSKSAGFSVCVSGFFL